MPACATTQEGARAAKLFEEHNYKAALPLFEEIVRNEPDNARARYYLALNYLRLGQLERASIHFSQVIAIAPGSDEARYSRLALAQMESKPASTGSVSSDVAATAPPNTAPPAVIDKDFEAANVQAEQITAAAKKEADDLDAQADRLAADMGAVKAAKGTGRAYSQAAIDAATEDLRKRAREYKERAQRESDDVLMRARLRHEVVSHVNAKSTLPSTSIATTAPTPTQARETSSTERSVLHIDEISYWHQVKKSVPEQDWHRALMLKPKFRSEVLSGRTSVDALLAKYSDSERTTDERWISAHQSAQNSFKQESSPRIVVSGYSINQFVGLRSGPPSRLFDHDGICYKVFLDFDDAPKELTPALYAEYVHELARAGFVGDSKISMNPGFVRFYYNDVIVHTGSSQSAKLAERIGIKLFGASLAHIARGVDVLQTNDGGKWSDPIDWHQFLSASTDLSRLTPDALKFVNYED